MVYSIHIAQLLTITWKHSEFWSGENINALYKSSFRTLLALPFHIIKEKEKKTNQVKHQNWSNPLAGLVCNLQTYLRWCNISISLPASNCVYANKSQFKVLKQSLSPTNHCLPHPDLFYKSRLHHIINASSAHCQYKSYHLYSFPKASEPSCTKTKSWWKSKLSCAPH